MNIKTILFVAGLALFGQGMVKAQPLSRYQVAYMVSYDAGLQQYTAWVVPDYATPNANNTDQVEQGATAQFTLKAPASFSLTQVTDEKGNWTKRPLRIGTETGLVAAGADPAFIYYVIGKSVEETSYGAFRAGEPVALFHFKGQGATPGQVQALDKFDPVLKMADQLLSLNIGNSFYSRSGQPASATARPMEQFSGITTVSSVLKQVEKQVVLGTQNQVSVSEGVIPMLVYPNPTTDELQVKVFSQRAGNPVRLELTDALGRKLQTKIHVAQSGFNTFLLKLGQYAGGTYYLRTEIDGKQAMKGINKL